MDSRSEQRSAKRRSAARENELRDAIDEAETGLAESQRQYLTACGWNLTCNTPGSLWLWEKKLPDGRTALCGVETAIHIQETL